MEREKGRIQKVIISRISGKEYKLKKKGDRQTKYKRETDRERETER